MLAVLLIGAIAISAAGCVWHFPTGTVRLSGNQTERIVEGTGNADHWEVQIDRLSFSDDKNAVIRLVPSDTVRVEASYCEKLEDYGFSITAEDGIIRIGTDHHYTYRTEHFTVTVYADFNRIVLSGGCGLDIDASGRETLKVNLSGASDCEIRGLDAKQLDVSVSGAAELGLHGKVDHFALYVSGAADTEAKALVCQSAELHVSGAGNVSISVLDSLSASISGAGSVSYYGSPKTDNQVSGVGSVKQISENIYAE